MHVRGNGDAGNVAARSDEDVVANFQWVEGHLPSAHAHGRPDDAVCADDGAAGDAVSFWAV